MRLSYFIAQRYFLSPKKKSFINVISIISMMVVAIGTMALIIVLSVFNGLEGLLRSLYETVDPNLIISAEIGKSFDYTNNLREKIAQTPGVESITEVLEDNALIKYNKSERIARVKGVSENFIDQGRLKDFMAYGDHKLMADGVPYALIGQGVRYDLSVNPSNDFYALQMYFPRNVGPGIVDPLKMYKVKNILPGGVFAVEKSYDENYIIVPISFTEELFGKSGKRSSVEVQVTPETTPEDLKTRLASALGSGFVVQSNEELHGGLYRVLRYEKFFVFLTFSVIIAIASINIFFSLTMLAIDKKKDIAILTAQGAGKKLIRKIFLIEGCMVAFSGAIVGLVLGLAISYIQKEFGIVTMGVQTAILDAYPIRIEWPDIFLTVICIVIITIVSSIQPAIKASENIEVKTIQ